MSSQPDPIRYKHVFNTFNVVTLTLMLTIGLMLCVSHVNLQFEADSRCWEKFKQQKCDINSPQGSECVRLY